MCVSQITCPSTTALQCQCWDVLVTELTDWMCRARSGQVTTQQLRLATQQSRLAELEAELSLTAETTEAARRESLVSRDQQAGLRAQLDQAAAEYSDLQARLAQVRLALKRFKATICCRPRRAWRARNRRWRSWQRSKGSGGSSSARWPTI